jgi:hypothetical protein
MIGIISGVNKTYIVDGSFDTPNKVEGNIYFHPTTKRLFMYIKNEKRSNPRTGFYPTWDGVNTYISAHSVDRYYPNDVIITDTSDMSQQVTAKKAEEIVHHQQRSMSGGPLSFQISDEDNFFTQCIKEILNKKQYTVVDLVQLSTPRLNDKIITNYCNALSKISFMRLEKWNIWLHNILHMKYEVIIRNGERDICSYKEPDQFTLITDHHDLLKKKMDPLKKLIKITMIDERIDKSDLRSDDIDEYTINNMMTILTGPKPVSAQLFSRFIHMADLSFQLNVYDHDDIIVTYRE